MLVGVATALAQGALAQAPLFTETFDDRAEGVLHNQNSWNAQQQNDAQVQADQKYAGTQAGLIATNTVVWRHFNDDTATNVWVDFYAYVTYPADASAPSLNGSVAGAFYIDDGGEIHAKSNATWVATGTTVPENTWRRFSVNLDYAASNWMLYVAGDQPNALATAVATNLAFTSSATNRYFRRFRVKN
jgi:hypothetical protein